MGAPAAQVLLGVACAALPSSFLRRLCLTACEAPRVASSLVACPAPPSASLRDPDPGPSLRTARRAQR